MSSYYIYLNGARRGPFDEEEVRRGLASGLLQAVDLAAEQAEGEWQALDSLPAFRADASPPLVRQAVTARAPAQAARLSQEALGPYARSTLAPDETPFFKTTLHWIIFLRFGVAGLVILLFAALPFAIAVQALLGSQIGWFALPLPAFVLVPPAVAYASGELIITDRRILVKTGIVQRTTMEIFLSKIESIGVEQSFLGRLLNYGTVIVRGTGGFEEALESIAEPLQFRSFVQRLQSGASAAAA